MMKGASSKRSLLFKERVVVKAPDPCAARDKGRVVAAAAALCKLAGPCVPTPDKVTYLSIPWDDCPHLSIRTWKGLLSLKLDEMHPKLCQVPDIVCGLMKIHGVSPHEAPLAVINQTSVKDTHYSGHDQVTVPIHPSSSPMKGLSCDSITHHCFHLPSPPHAVSKYVTVECGCRGR